MIIPVRLNEKSYDIVLERGVINRAKEELNLERKVMVVTDDGVPKEYAETIAKQCKTPVVFTMKQGEDHKTLQTVEEIERLMMQHEFNRKDCVVAVGGGVVGDLSGFAASMYMRGIDFYNIPTTVLSQVDSSIGGKTAVNLDNIKNIVGAFYQPKKVLIDVETLKTLPERQISSGLAEAVKMSLTSDAELFSIFEEGHGLENLELVIEKSLRIKEDVVSQDEKEMGLRKILNFGHTIGHGIEAVSHETGNDLYHGECVALGMLPMCSEEVRNRLKKVLLSLNLPTEISLPKEKVNEAMLHDKKSSGDYITTIFVETPGTFEMRKTLNTELPELISQAVTE